MADRNRSGRRPLRQRHDPEELRRLIRRRESEGLSYAELARRTGIPVGTLAWWSHRMRRGSKKRSVAAEFVEVVPTSDERRLDELEVRLPSGIVVQVPSGIDHPTTLRLLSAILSC